MAVGLNDADLFEDEPPTEQAAVLRAGQSAAPPVDAEPEA